MKTKMYLALILIILIIDPVFSQTIKSSLSGDVSYIEESNYDNDDDLISTKVYTFSSSKPIEIKHLNSEMNLVKYEMYIYESSNVFCTIYDDKDRLLSKLYYQFDGKTGYMYLIKEEEYNSEGKIIKQFLRQLNKDMTIVSESYYIKEIDGMIIVLNRVFTYLDDGITIACDEYDRFNNLIGKEYRILNSRREIVEIRKIFPNENIKQIQLEYDIDGFLISQRIFNEDNILQSSAAYVYDEMGNIISKKYYKFFNDQVYSYEYDNQNNWIKKTVKEKNRESDTFQNKQTIIRKIWYY